MVVVVTKERFEAEQLVRNQAEKRLLEMLKQTYSPEEAQRIMDRCYEARAAVEGWNTMPGFIPTDKTTPIKISSTHPFCERINEVLEYVGGVPSDTPPDILASGKCVSPIVTTTNDVETEHKCDYVFLSNPSGIKISLEFWASNERLGRVDDILNITGLMYHPLDLKKVLDGPGELSTDIKRQP